MKDTPLNAALDATAPPAGNSASAPRRAVKKTAVKQAKKKSASALVAPEAPEERPLETPAEPAAVSVPRKTAAKKTAAKKVVRRKEPAADSPGEKPPVTAPAEAAERPEPALVTPVLSAFEEPPAAPKKAARKAPSRKTAATVSRSGHSAEKSAESPQAAPVSTPKDEAPAAEISPSGPTAPPERPQPEPSPATAENAGFQPQEPSQRFPQNRETSGEGGEWSPGAGGHSPRHARPARPPFPAPQSHSRPSAPQDRERPRADSGPQDQDTVLGPDGLPRRLNKWERWKLRKEKFKLQKQQRFLERQAGPGPEMRRPHEPPHGHRPQESGPPPFRERPPYQERPQRPEPQLGPPEETAGLLEMTGKGFAFLRPADRNFASVPTDPFVSPEMIRQYGLREGVWIEGIHRRSPRGSLVTEITKVNGLAPDAYRTLPLFEELTAINPNKRYILETTSNRYTTRIIDFIAPIGRGQRGLIVAPPRAGKTTFLQHIAEAVLENYKGVKVIVLLVDERPEEVTEIARALPGAEIMASSNDQDPRNHIRLALLAVERAKRLVEAGEHVFMLLDSITRLARGFNNSMRGGGGKAMSGGIDSRALEAPRKLFAAARNTREAGSLTIMATALVETNSKGDELIFQEFKGTGNMELVLDRKIAQQYVYPAVDIFKSGTRREELLLPPHQLEKIHLIRRGLAGHRPVEAMERLLQFMQKFPNNAQMLIEIKSRE